MIGAGRVAAAVLADAAAELREAENERVVEHPLVLQIVVERKQAVVQRRHQVVIRAVGLVDVLRRVIVEAAGRHVEHLRADALVHRAGHGPHRQAERRVGIRERRRVVGHGGDAVERGKRRLRAFVDERHFGTTDRDVRVHAHRRGLLGGRLGTGVRARERVSCRVGDRGYGDVVGRQDARQAAGCVPSDQRIDRRRQRIEIPAYPAEALRVAGIAGRPNIRTGEMRPALIRIAGALHEREPALIEDLLQAGEARVQAQRHVRRVGPDLQNVGGRHGQRRPAAVVKRILIGDHRADRVVAAAQIEHHQVPDACALRAREIAQKLGRRERHGEGGGAALHELASGDFHTNWYSAEPAIKWTNPGAFAWSWASLPVHAVVARK